MLQTGKTAAPARSERTLPIWGVFLVVVIPSLCALALVWPGFFQADHQSTLAGVALGQPNAWHSVLWAYLAYPLLYLAPSYGWYGFLQILLYGVATTFSITRLDGLGLLTPRAKAFLIVVYAICPSFLLYNQLWSSDIVFAIALIPLTTLLIESVVATECLHRPSYCVAVALLLFTCYELRKNALLFVVILAVVMLLRYKDERKRVLAIVGGLIGCMAVSAFLTSVVLQVKKSPSQELLSVPAQQIARVFTEDKAIDSDALDIFLSVRPEQEWKANYLPGIADPEKKDLQLNPSFALAWLDTGLRNPGSYWRAYRDLMYPYWKFTSDDTMLGMNIDFGNNDTFTIGNNKLRKGYLDQFSLGDAHKYAVARSVMSVRDSWIPVVADSLKLVFFNRALPLWFLVGAGVYAWRRHMLGSYLFIACPLVCILLSLLLFSPVASMRYAMQMMYSIPVVWAGVAGIAQAGKRESADDHVAA